MTFVEKYRKSRQQRDKRMKQKLNQLNEQKLKNRQQYIQKEKQSIASYDQINQMNEYQNSNLITKIDTTEQKILDAIQQLLQLEKKNQNIQREIQKSQQHMQQTLRALHEGKQNQLLGFKKMLQLVNFPIRVIEEQQIPNQQFVINALQDEYLMQQINEQIVQAGPKISINLTRQRQRLEIACIKIQQMEKIMKNKQLAQKTAREQIENLSNRLTQEKFQVKMLVEQNIKMVQKLGGVKKLLKEMFQMQI